MVNENIEEKNESVAESVEPVQEAAEGAESETTEEVKQEAAESPEAGKPDNRDDPEFVKHVQNWRALREAKERAERERDEIIAQMQKGSPQQQQEELSYNDDDLIEGKHLKQSMSKTDRRIQQLEGQLIEAQIRAKFPDFDKVVTQETLGMLKDTDPELAESLAANRNLYSQAVAAYKSIKRYGLHGNDYVREKETVNTNVSKPRTVTSLSPQQGDSPLTRANAFANGLTDDLKKQLYQEMKDLANS